MQDAIVKLNYHSAIMMEWWYKQMLSLCDSYLEDFSYNNFIDCVNNIYAICSFDGKVLEIVGGRRRNINDDLLKDVVSYIPTRYRTVYTMDILTNHYTEASNLKGELIETFCNDKNDSFIIFKPKCKHNTFNKLRYYGFIRIDIGDECYYVREPRTSSMKDKERKRIIKKFRR